MTDLRPPKGSYIRGDHTSYLRARRQIARKLGLCPRCMSRPAAHDRRLCLRCLNGQRRQPDSGTDGQLRRADARRRGICTRCLRAPARDGMRTCEICGAR